MVTDFWFNGRLAATDVAWLAPSHGERSKLLEVAEWVLDAHAHLERRGLPLFWREYTEQPVTIPLFAHEQAVKELEELLLRTVELKKLAYWSVRARLLEAIPGVNFPLPNNAAQFQELISMARNVNALLAQASTFSCGCGCSRT